MLMRIVLLVCVAACVFAAISPIAAKPETNQSMNTSSTQIATFQPIEARYVAEVEVAL